MPRHHQPNRWIHRRSRLLLAAIATIGAIETAFLTMATLTGGDVCPTEGCDRVVNSPYATVFGLPLTLFGFLGYVAMVALATAPLWINPNQRKDLRQTLENRTWLLIFGLATAMLTFSAYLMVIMTFEIRAFCIFCVVSALLALAMFVISIVGHRWRDVGQLVFAGFIIATVTLVSIMAIYAPIRAGNGDGAIDPNGETGPAITTTSGPAEIALAQHLSGSGALFYATWWCPFCHDQKQLFGVEATALLPYVECDPQGVNPQPEVCQAQPDLQGYPSWEIGGELYPGLLPLEQLADLSGYTGPMDFRH